MTRAVHVLGSLNRGGAEMVALDLCKAIDSSEVQQLFYCLSGSEGSLAPEFRNAGALTRVVALRPISTFAVRLWKQFRADSPDVVVSHVSLTTSWVLLIAWLARVPTRIARIHSDGDGKGNGSARRVYRSACRLLLGITSTHVVAVTDSALAFATLRSKRIAEVARTTLCVLPNGIDTERFRPNESMSRISAATSSVVLYVGRGDPEKRRNLLPKIQKSLSDRLDNVFLVVGGAKTIDIGPYDFRCIQILGDRSDVADLMRSADALILPSSREGLPGVVLEAAASGLPVVATDLPGIQHIALAVEGIRMVAADSPPSTWAHALEAAIETDEAGRITIRNSFLNSPFALNRSVRAWRRLYGVDSA